MEAAFEKMLTQFLDAVQETFPARAGEVAAVRARPAAEVRAQVAASTKGRADLVATEDAALWKGEAVIPGLEIGAMFEESSPATRATIWKYVKALVLLADDPTPGQDLRELFQKMASQDPAAPAEAAQAAGLPDLGFIGKLAEEIVDDDMQKKMESVLEKNPEMLTKMSNPFALFQEIQKPDTELGSLFQTMSGKIQETLTKNPQVVQQVQQQMTTLAQTMGPMLQNLMQGMGGGAAAPAGMDLGALMKAFGGMAMGGAAPSKEKEDDLPALEDIENKNRKEFRQKYREALKKKAEERTGKK